MIIPPLWPRASRQPAPPSPGSSGLLAIIVAASGSAVLALGIAPAATQVKVPLCAGLTIVGAVSEPHGDYEPIVTVQSIGDSAVNLQYSTQVATRTGALRQVDVRRSVLLSDLRASTFFLNWFVSSASATIPGSTAIGTSSAVLRSLKTKGTAELALVDRENSGLVADRTQSPNIYQHLMAYPLQRVGSGSATLPVIVNDVKADLPVVHATGTYMGDTVEFFFLDDESNPLALKSRRHSTIAGGPTEHTQVVKISYRCQPDSPAATAVSRLERTLLESGRVDVYDIYFRFNSDEIRKESEPTLQEIAALLRRQPTWKLAIEGHTDSIASDAYNLELSARRAASVKRALTQRHGADGNRLSTSGAGEARPKDRNDTLDGRARNRRVELVRQPEAP